MAATITTGEVIAGGSISGKSPIRFHKSDGDYVDFTLGSPYWRGCNPYLNRQHVWGNRGIPTGLEEFVIKADALWPNDDPLYGSQYAIGIMGNMWIYKSVEDSKADIYNSIVNFLAPNLNGDIVGWPVDPFQNSILSLNYLVYNLLQFPDKYTLDDSIFVIEASDKFSEAGREFFTNGLLQALQTAEISWTFNDLDDDNPEHVEHSAAIVDESSVIIPALHPQLTPNRATIISNVATAVAGYLSSLSPSVIHSKTNGIIYQHDIDLEVDAPSDVVDDTLPPIYEGIPVVNLIASFVPSGEDIAFKIAHSWDGDIHSKQLPLAKSIVYLEGGSPSIADLFSDSLPFKRQMIIQEGATVTADDLDCDPYGLIALSEALNVTFSIFQLGLSIRSWGALGATIKNIKSGLSDAEILAGLTEDGLRILNKKQYTTVGQLFLVGEEVTIDAPLFDLPILLAPETPTVTDALNFLQASKVDLTVLKIKEDFSATPMQKLQAQAKFLKQIKLLNSPAASAAGNAVLYEHAVNGEFQRVQYFVTKLKEGTITISEAEIAITRLQEQAEIQGSALYDFGDQLHNESITPPTPIKN